MLMLFEEFTKEWDFETDRLEPIIINTDAINCIKTVGEDRIKKYYFMIPETK